MEVPPEGEHLWEWFWTLSRRRRSGPEAITFTEIGAWMRATNTRVRPEEIEVLTRMDDAFLKVVRQEQADAAERAREQTRTKR